MRCAVSLAIALICELGASSAHAEGGILTEQGHLVLLDLRIAFNIRLWSGTLAASPCRDRVPTHRQIFQDRRSAKSGPLAGTPRRPAPPAPPGRIATLSPVATPSVAATPSHAATPVSTAPPDPAATHDHTTICVPICPGRTAMARIRKRAPIPDKLWSLSAMFASLILSPLISSLAVI